jgi:mannan endo-1,4-beta-mannosidase
MEESVTISWHFNNPWTGGDSWDTTKEEKLWELITPGSDIYKKWQAQKKVIANALRPLRDAGVPVLWRPLQEMNGDWYWWGEKNWQGHEDAYTGLWRDMFTYLTYEQNMNNLLWVYSTATTYDRLIKNYYPGIDCVDVVGIDLYDDNVQTAFTKRDYNDLKSLVTIPWGSQRLGQPSRLPTVDMTTRRLLNNMASSWPDAVFSYSWHDWPGAKIFICHKQVCGTDIFAV